MSNDRDGVKVEKKKRRRNILILLVASPLVCLCTFLVVTFRSATSPEFAVTMTAIAVDAAKTPVAVIATAANAVQNSEETAVSVNTLAPTATSAPTSTPEPDGRSRQSPALPGSAVSVDGMEMGVDHIQFPTDQELDQANRFNPTAEDGKRLLMVYASLSCVKDTSETCSVSRGDFEAFGSAGIVYQPIYNIVGIPDELDDLEFFGGASAIKWVAFEVGADETNFVLAYEPFLGLEQAYLRLPDEEAAEAGN